MIKDANNISKFSFDTTNLRTNFCCWLYRLLDFYVHRNFIWKRSKTQHQIIRVRYNTIQKTRKILTNKLHETSLLSPFMSFATSNMTVIKRLIRPPIKRKSSVNVYGLLCRLWMYWLWQHHVWKNEIIASCGMIKSKSIMISLKFVWILLIVILLYSIRVVFNTIFRCTWLFVFSCANNNS